MRIITATSIITLCLLAAALCPSAAAQDDPATRPATAPATRPTDAVTGTIVDVVCYEGSALVTREVRVPAGAGLVEVTVGPLPPSLRPDTLYAESDADGVRVLTTRYRQRVERDATDERVREFTAEVERLGVEIEKADARRQAIEQDLQFVGGLQSFANGNVNRDAADAEFAAQGFIEFAEYLIERRRELLESRVEVAEEIRQLREQQQFARQQLQEAQAGGGSRVVREATVVVDNAGGGGATVRLAYLVNAAGWRPQYRLRADADADAATLEYLAAVSQNTGEDWQDVRLTLSTASPNLNASPPELEPVRVALVADDRQQAQQQVAPKMKSLAAANEELRQAQSAYGEQLGQPGGDFGGAADEFAARRKREGAVTLNRAAARVLEAEVLGEAPAGGQPILTEGQSVTFKLDGRVTVPWRDDEQLLEIARQPLEPDLFYKAVPVLTPNVYRVAEFTNGGDDARVILPGPCGVYLGGDFVGRTDLPLVAVGRPFTVGLGIDPQLAVTRQLAGRDTDVRGGNQVRRVEYVLRIESYKDEPVPVRLWDRLPTGPEGDDDSNALGVELVQNSSDLSDDAEYQRDDRPEGLLRWDMEVGPETPAEVRFAYTLAFDRALEIGGFETK